VHLTPKISDYIQLVATARYLTCVEDGDIPLLATKQRKAFVEHMVKSAIFAIDATPNKNNNLTREYQRRVKRYFASRSTVLNHWRRFEVQLAVKEGRLSPERLVDDFLKGMPISYGQRSALASYAQRVIQASIAKNRSLDQIIRNVNRRLKTAPPYVRILAEKEVVTV